MTMSNLKIEHDAHMVSFLHLDRKTSNFYNYMFRIVNGVAKIYCIQLLQKGGRVSKNYKLKEIYHDIVCNGDGKIYNYSTNEYEEVEIPEEVAIWVKNYTKGFLINCI